MSFGWNILQHSPDVRSQKLKDFYKQVSDQGLEEFWKFLNFFFTLKIKILMVWKIFIFLKYYHPLSSLLVEFKAVKLRDKSISKKKKSDP
jgi:hypothetical protein